jgi:hypothetical protein
VLVHAGALLKTLAARLGLGAGGGPGFYVTKWFLGDYGNFNSPRIWGFELRAKF